MSKKKSKRKKKNQGKLKHKQTLDRNRKKYLLALDNIAKATGAYDVYKKIPKREIERLLSIKFDSFRIEEAEKGKLKVRELSALKFYASSYLKTREFTIIEGNPKITFPDYFKVGEPLKCYIMNLKDDDFPAAKEVKERFQPFLSYIDDENTLKRHLVNYSRAMAWNFSTIHMGYYHFTPTIGKNSNNSSYLCFKVEAFKPELTNLKIKGINRPVYRVGFPTKQNELEWMKIKASDLTNTVSLTNVEYDVYVQSHVLVRLKERLDSIIEMELHVSLIFSLYKANIIKDFKGTSLIELKIFEQKAGYLVAEIVEGVVLIKTFLFLTNNGTPEAEKLKELSGLSTVGKKYFEIDKLSTFMHSNISKDEKLKSLFMEAGCGSLFKIFSVRKTERPEISSAKPILKYLNIE